MQICVVSTSNRTGSQSKIVSEVLTQKLLSKNVTTVLLDLHELSLPLYDDTSAMRENANWQKISKTLSESDSFVFVSPEWDGMFSVALHNMLHFVSRELSHKPVLLVGVSDGRGGRYPLSQMRQMGYKNKRFVVIPESLYFEHVKKNVVEGEIVDTFMEKRTNYALDILHMYTNGFANISKNEVIDYENFGSGL